MHASIPNGNFDLWLNRSTYMPTYLQYAIYSYAHELYFRLRLKRSLTAGGWRRSTGWMVKGPK